MTVQEYQRQYRNKHRKALSDYGRAWRAAHPERCAAYTKKYRAKVPDKCREWAERFRASQKGKDYQKRWSAANRASKRASCVRWRKKHPHRQKLSSKRWMDKNRSYMNKYERQRCATDPSFRLGKRLRARVRSALLSQGVKKTNRTLELVGCNREFLVKHLQAKFAPGMTWDNYGSVWEIDHRVPCKLFDLTDRQQQLACFNFSNLQPLSVFENRSKHCKLIV